MSVPPPMHQPWTAAIVGFCAYQSFMYTSTKRRMKRQSATESQARRPVCGSASGGPDASAWAVVAQRGPWPAQTARPSARRRITRTAGSASARSMASASSSRSAGVIVLYSRARVKTIEHTPSAISVRRVAMGSQASPAGRGAVNRPDFRYGTIPQPMRLAPVPGALLTPVLGTLTAVVGRAAALGDAVALGDGMTMGGFDELRQGKVALDRTDEKLDSRLRGMRGLRADGPLRAGPRRAPAWRRGGDV